MILLFLVLSYPILDSLEAHYNLYRPERLSITAKCSIIPELEFKVNFSKGESLEVKSLSDEPEIGEPLICELIKWMIFLTGLGITELWHSLGGVNFIDTVIIKDDWFTIIPKDTTLFAKAEIKIENWLIKEAKIRAENQDIYAKIEYKAELPVSIKVKSNNSKFTITHYYESNLRIPQKTEIIGESKDIPPEWKHIVITYSK